MSAKFGPSDGGCGVKKILTAALVLLCLLAGAGYLVGDYFLGYALRRGEHGEPPAACAKIADPALETPARPPARSETWEIRSSDGLVLRGTCFYPAAPSHRWAILVHGYGRTKEFAWDYAKEYLEHGYNVLAPDLRAAGESEGTYLTMGTLESEDIALWAAQIAQRDPEARIALHGVSMGAATVMMASALDPPHVESVIEDCGYTSAYDMFTMQLKEIFGLPEFPIMGCVDLVSRLKMGCALSDAAPLESVPRTRVPMLFIHGDADKLVPFSMMQELYDASSAPEKESMVVVGAGHAAAKSIDSKSYFRKIFSFLDTHMGMK